MRVERTGLGQRLRNSLVAMVLGVVLFFGSFVVLFLNEGRENLAGVARGARLYEATATYDETDLLYVIGSLSSTAPLSDNYLQAGHYIRLIREVEMYAYVEIEHTRTREHVGGSQTTEYTYTYEKQWVNDPRPTVTYKGVASERPTDIPAGYDAWITSMPQSRLDTASNLAINGIPMSSENLVLSNPKSLVLSESVVDLAALTDNETVHPEAIFRRNTETGTLDNPQVGDVRIAYRAVMNTDEGLLLAAFSEGMFLRYMTPNDNRLYRFFTGTTTLSDAIDRLQDEYTAMLWILRIVGFVMMFSGLLLMANPARTLLSVLPIFAKVGMFVYGFFALMSSLTLSVLVIVLAMLFHNALLAVGVVLLIVLALIFYLRSKKQKAINAT